MGMQSRGNAACIVLSVTVATVLSVVGFGSFQSGLSSATLLGDEYQNLLHREKQVLRSGPGGLDWGNQRFLTHASDEQESYVAQKTAKALKEGKEAQKDAAKLFYKWSDPYRGTVYEKFDNPAEDKAATTELTQLDSNAAKLRQLAAESKAKQREAKASCKGNSGCEKILEQVLNLVHKTGTS